MSNFSCYEIAKDFASPILTTIAILISVLIAFKQLSKQHENSLELKKEEIKSKTRIDLFKEINDLLEASNTQVREINSHCFGKKYSNIEMKAAIDHVEFLELMKVFSSALLTVASKVEYHEIVNLKLFRVFRYSLYSIHHDLLALQTEKDRFKVLEKLIELTNDSMMYFGDFQVCMQNMTYGETFNSTVPERVPANKKIKVITNCSENLDALQVYFEKESNWGKSCTKYESEAKEKFSS
ncbi:hypothetical protein GCE9029_00802 [Grimontia celer]|uniref:Uncharacterized protein n=2 Tax=Grimontia celer TaxID=1796497 RepID=A0A128EW18_9GAMM|nr:hypothetical protein GCE9029_00802 [Grimontia celer]